MTPPIARAFLAFAGVGALATAVQYVILALLVELFDAPPALSSATGFALSALLNYALNYRFTFRSSAAHGVALPRFLLVASTGLILNTALMALLAEVVGAHYLVAQVLATGLVLLWNFAASLLWAFRDRPRHAALNAAHISVSPPP